MTKLSLRRGVVVSAEESAGVLELIVEVGGRARPAIAYPDLTGPVQPGDDVVVNTAAVDLGLGSGGFDVLCVNLTRGLDGSGVEGAHVMKLNYTPLQHAVAPVEDRAAELIRPLSRPVAVIAIHGQLPCVAWAAAQRAAGACIGYIQTAGGALPGWHSRVARDLRERGLLAGHVTAGPAFGGQDEAITAAGALHAAFSVLDWDAAIVGPGPGILGSATPLGHGGLAALDSAHAALALGCPTLIVPRMSSGDERERHQGLSHHTRTVLDLLLRPVVVALPEGADADLGGGGHSAVAGLADLEGYAATGLPATTMGRTIEEDELFFRAALAGGAALGDQIRGV
jgi:uncharacterized protein DUF3866